MTTWFESLLRMREKLRAIPSVPVFQYRPVEPCGMACGRMAPGVYVWAWGEGDHRIERNVCAECVSRGKPEFAPVLDATPSRASHSHAGPEA